MGSQLISVPPPRSPVFRVARGIDPFVPRGWSDALVDGTFGNRFDDPGALHDIPEPERFRTVYCTTDRVGAYGEVVARLRPSVKVLRELTEIDDDEPVGDILQNIVDPIDPERGVITLEWQLKRRLGYTYLDQQLRFVDLLAPETMHALRYVLAPLLDELGVGDFDLSAATSQQRRLTQEIARHVYEQVDAQGTPQFAGIRYLSRLSPGWECWAIFDTRMIHQPGPAETVHVGDSGLGEAARIFGLTIEGPTRGQYIRA